MGSLILIPARAGSKGLPGKNIKMLGNKPLIAYTIEFAQNIKKPGDFICISSNDDEVLSIAKDLGIEIYFKRPENLSDDKSSMNDVVLHAINYFKERDISFDTILLLQPTSPFRAVEDYEKMLSLFDENCDMVVTVKKSKDNPYFTLYEEDGEGYLKKSKKMKVATRQAAPPVYAYNGSMYLVNSRSFLKSAIHEFKRIKKVLLPEERSIDIDDMRDWVVAEYYLANYSENN